MHILGTAGHVDHGKSSLVRALTGTNPDRWLEERERGMTLDLGFARLRFDDGVEAGIVDVPGHERFLHNMLAGAAGMELLMLVIAANEGPRPQTLEHLAILQFLNVKRTIVVLTKSDLVDASDLEIARELIGDALRDTIAAGAPAIAVSSLTGAGLDELRAAIHDALLSLAPRAPQAPPYLPIDRVFALPGHGTIVTGTLMQGTIAVGETLALAPPMREVRVRSLQVFGERRDRVEGGARVAVNLPGVDTAEVARGAVLAAPGIEPRSTFAVRFRPLPQAIGILRRRMPVRAYVGAAELLGTLVFAEVPAAAGDVTATLHVRAPAIAIPGEAFVVRRVSPKTLLGGGTIDAGDAAGPAAFDIPPELAAIEAALAAFGIDGATAMRAGERANLRADRATELLERACDDGRAYRLARPSAYVAAAPADDLAARAVAHLEAAHAAAPWSMGLTSLALSRALKVAEPALVRVLAHYVDDGRVLYRGGYYATPGFTPALRAEQRAFFERALEEDAAQPNLPASFDAVSAAMKASPVAGIAAAFDMLVATGAIVKIGDALYTKPQLDRIRAALQTFVRREGQITMAQFRDLVGTSRKYVVPLLEWFDASGVTVRSGDYRRLRESRSA